MIALLDVNVLVALFDDGHIHHEAAHDWFTDNRALGWASCPITENGVMRILGNPSYPAGLTPIPEIAARLDTFCAATNITSSGPTTSRSGIAHGSTSRACVGIGN